MSFFHQDPHYVSGVYVISVASRMLGMHPQTLRKYERLGFIMPSRTVGMLRLYSEEDIARLRLIKYLVEERGLNIAGVQLALNLFADYLDLRSKLESLGIHQAEVAISDSVQEMLDAVQFGRL
ncbi:MAG: MerR family transcriptional regulator [Dehalococcoidia bacterium]|tara:strand:+ start:31 stop:399 length:369 start_codon:yes stop_codon:yes gene_type:complete